VIAGFSFFGWVSRLWNKILPETFGLGRAAFLLFALVHLFFLRPLLGISHFPFDYDLYNYPLLKAVFDHLKAGHLPLWNPFEYCGAPFLSNPQAAVFYPVHHILFWPLIFLGKHFGQQAAQFLGPFHYSIAATGVFFFLKRLQLPSRAALMGGIFFTFSGWLLAQAQHLGLIETISWMPWAYAFAWGTARKKGLREPALLSLSLAFSFHAGFLPEFLTMVCFLGFYILWLLREGESPASLVPSLMRFGLAALLFVGMALPILLPMVQDLGTGPTLSFHQGILPQALETILAPNSLRHFGSIGRFLGRGDPTSSYLYPGILVLLFFPRGLGGKTLFFAGAFLITLLCGVSPWAEFFLFPLHRIPLLGALFRGESFVTQGAFFASVIAAFGFARKPQLVALARTAVVLFVLLLLMVPLSLLLKAPSHWEKILLWGPVFLGVLFLLKHFRRPIPLLVFLGFLDLLGTGSLLESVQYPGPSRTVKNVLQSTWFGNLLERMDEGDKALGRQFHPEELGRVLADQGRMGGVWLGSYPCLGLESLQGFQPQRHDAYFRLVCKDLATWKTDRLFFGTKDRDHFFRKTNLRWLITGELSQEPGPPWKVVGRFGPVRLYELPNPAPRFFTIPVERMLRKGGRFFYPQEMGELRPVSLKVLGNASFAGQVEGGERGAVLHLGLVAFPGWRAEVDGKAVAPLALDGVFLGVPIPKGTHRIQVEYWPKGLYWVLSSGAGALVLALMLASGTPFVRRGARGKRGLPGGR